MQSWEFCNGICFVCNLNWAPSRVECGCPGSYLVSEWKHGVEAGELEGDESNHTLKKLTADNIFCKKVPVCQEAQNMFPVGLVVRSHQGIRAMQSMFLFICSCKYSDCRFLRVLQICVLQIFMPFLFCIFFNILLILQAYLAGLTYLLWESGGYSGFWDQNCTNVQIISKQRLVWEFVTHTVL